METPRDTVFQDTRPETISPFEFDDKVAAVFDDMLVRSIPLYEELQHLVVKLALQHAREHSTIYDIGCSTGTTLKNLIRALPQENFNFIGVDASSAMIERAQEKLNFELNNSIPLTLLTQAAEELQFDSSSFITALYTLQFTPLEARASLLKRLHAALTPNGAFVLAEKIDFEDEYTRELMEYLYYSFKLRQGYSKQEILAKKRALEGVLVPLTLEEHRKLLLQAGFQKVDVLLQAYNFTTLIAYA